MNQLLDINEDYGRVLTPDTVQIKRVLPGPIERVWAYLTESDKRGQWLATGDMDLRVGGEFELSWHHNDLSPDKQPTPERYKHHAGHTMRGRITSYEPPRVLAYTWGKTGSSEVTFELTPQGDDVLLVLTHSHLPTRGDMRGVSGGWHSHLRVLIDRLNDRVPESFWKTHEQVEREYARLIPGD